MLREITGKVYDASGKPLKNARIYGEITKGTLADSVGTYSNRFSAATDANGDIKAVDGESPLKVFAPDEAGLSVLIRWTGAVDFKSVFSREDDSAKPFSDLRKSSGDFYSPDAESFYAYLSERIASVGGVTSVNSKAGAVVLNPTDLGLQYSLKARVLQNYSEVEALSVGTLPILFIVLADETNGGAKTFYIYDGGNLSRL